MKRNKSQIGLFNLLKLKSLENKKVTIAEILDATGWKNTTFKTYENKGQLAEFLNNNGEGIYTISNIGKCSELQFLRKLTQDKTFSSLGHVCNSKLAKALLNKSKDNMLLALELYNRPSLVNKLDGFVVLFCIAWEQILKSFLIEKEGEETIYTNVEKEKTISLQICIEKVFNRGNIIYHNIDDINDIRNSAVHLLVPEIQSTISRLFQSGVRNYISFFESFAKESFLESNLGLVSIVSGFSSYENTQIINLYGDKTGNAIIKLIDKYSNKINSYNDVDYAIPLDVEVTFAKKNKSGYSVLSRAEEGVDALKSAIVINKSRDPKETHPYTERSMVLEINKRLAAKHSSIEILGKETINKYCFQAVAAKLKWKSANNEYHYKFSATDKNITHLYSVKAIIDFVDKIMLVKDFYKNARLSYSKSKS